MSILGGVYRHYKGNFYCVRGYGINHADGKQMVMYRKFEQNKCVGPIWIRSEDEFIGYRDIEHGPDDNSTNGHPKRFYFQGFSHKDYDKD